MSYMQDMAPKNKQFHCAQKKSPYTIEVARELHYGDQYEHIGLIMCIGQQLRVARGFNNPMQIISPNHKNHTTCQLKTK